MERYFLKLLFSFLYLYVHKQQNGFFMYVTKTISLHFMKKFALALSRVGTLNRLSTQVSQVNGNVNGRSAVGPI